MYVCGIRDFFLLLLLFIFLFLFFFFFFFFFFHFVCRPFSAGFVPVMSGYRVWKSILRNSHRVKITGSDDAYEAFYYTREGGYLRAVEDFYSMKPDDVRYFYKDNHVCPFAHVLYRDFFQQ